METQKLITLWYRYWDPTWICFNLLDPYFIGRFLLCMMIQGHRWRPSLTFASALMAMSAATMATATTTNTFTDPEAGFHLLGSTLAFIKRSAYGSVQPLILALCHPLVTFLLLAVVCGLVIGGCAGFATEAFSAFVLSSTWGPPPLRKKETELLVNKEQAQVESDAEEDMFVDGQYFDYEEGEDEENEQEANRIANSIRRRTRRSEASVQQEYE